ncbi:geranylgeranyl transferase type-1 subunit beta [Saxophila tyrrhenica]|uniref:Geranylgeranyl transferase type-1 subunit beta n=1 Tax=Saxophila tyrrhenica TaxID=1690608 RepID=A0AAV9PIT6_9PEZI|nr:geranylgeranyl transferase type-1 subunit beta [Saxophila tyrrhenica]
MDHTKAVDDATTPPQLDKKRQVKYWTRCVKTLLPFHYIGLDSNRMYMGYFILAALDLLDVLETVCSETERRDFADWIYSCQSVDGGFKMWRGTDFGDQTNDLNRKWDPANVPATYFALVALLVLGDDFKRVKRRETLHWLRKMQRPDGSFGETLVNGQIEGGRDPRYGYCATGARYILRGARSGPLTLDGEDIRDIDVDAFVECVRLAEAFDGGIADQPYNEPHAGYTYCSLGALNFVGRLQKADLRPSQLSSRYGPSNPQEVVRWLVQRQTEHIDPDASIDSDTIGSNRTSKVTDRELENILPNNHGAPPNSEQTPSQTAPPDHSFTSAAAAKSQIRKPSYTPQPSTLPDHDSATTAICAGMNGRVNKTADTCYAWWSGASFHVLGQPKLYNHAAVQNYLLEKTQNPVLGGFGKFPGDAPDLYHSYLGLTALSLVGCEGVKEVDAGMCVSRNAKGRLKGVWERWGVEGSLN